MLLTQVQEIFSHYQNECLVHICGRRTEPKDNTDDGEQEHLWGLVAKVDAEEFDNRQDEDGVEEAKIRGWE